MGIPVFFASHIPSRRFALGNRIHWLCRLAGANRKGRAPGERRLCWRGPTKKQGLAGSKAPTGKAARWGNGAYVGVAQRKSKGLGGARRQQGRLRAGKKAPGLAWPDEGTRACGMQGANMEGRAAGIGNRKRAAAAALFVLLTSVVLFRQKCSFQ